MVYTAQGKYAAAEPFYERALALAEQIFGPDHPAVAQSRTNLAALYRVTDRVTKADELDQRAACGCVRLLRIEARGMWRWRSNRSPERRIP